MATVNLDFVKYGLDLIFKYLSNVNKKNLTNNPKIDRLQLTKLDTVTSLQDLL